jgi:hypothetical protein
MSRGTPARSGRGWTPGDPQITLERQSTGALMGGAWTLLGIPLVLAGCAAEPPPEPLYMWEARVGGAWCYHTIADPDCYSRPLPDEADRLIASGPNIYFGWRPNPALEPAPAPVTRTDD